jgi:selT/selW/selH-like putative selenoprotein
LADAIKESLGIKPKLIKSHSGAFEVSVDGKKIFSKLETGRFPKPAEILSAIGKL